VSPPRALLLDLAGVLADFDRDGRTARLAEVAGVSAEEVDARLYDSGLVPAADAGEVSAEEFRAELRTRLGLPDDETTERLWASAFTPDPAALAVLADLDPGLPRGVLTNNDALLGRVLPRLLPEVFAGMDPIAFAGALGAAKPDAEAYLCAVAPWGVNAADVLFIDDSEANVDGARAAGLRAEQAAGADELAAVLAAARLLGA
jgi:HAD superfamily hydrolase (TIGR01509 family)